MLILTFLGFKKNTVKMPEYTTGHDIEIKIETELFYSTFKGDIVKQLVKQQTGLLVKSNLLMAGRLVRTVHL